MTSVVSGNPQRIPEEEPGLSYPTQSTLKVRTTLRSRVCQEGDVLHAGDFRSGDTGYFRRAAGVSDVAGQSVHDPPCLDTGLSGGFGAGPPGQRARPQPPAGTGSATCPHCACAAGGSAQGLPPLRVRLLPPSPAFAAAPT